MNKYLGFYKLKSLSIPSICWERFAYDTELDKRKLWTVRVAVEKSNDLHLPRLIGASAEEAVKKGRELLVMFADRGMVVYYPYFIAEKSGVLEISNSRTVIEAVDKDLWNLVTFGIKNVTMVYPNSPTGKNVVFHGDKDFLSYEEVEELHKCASIIKGAYRDELNEGRSIFAEWSYAFDTDVSRNPEGERYLVFFELRGL
jgi:hypothetical protein